MKLLGIIALAMPFLRVTDKDLGKVHSAMEQLLDVPGKDPLAITPEAKRGGPQRAFCEADVSVDHDMQTIGMDLGKIRNAVEQRLGLPGEDPLAITPRAKRGGPQRALCVAIESAIDDL